MNKNIAIIAGDGVGPEVTQQSVKVLNAIAEEFGHEFNYSYALIGAEATNKTGEPLPAKTVETCVAGDAILFGAIKQPKYDEDPMVNFKPEQGLLTLTKTLRLFANIRPVTTYHSLYHLSPLKNKLLENVDLVIFRELTGGSYFGNKQVNEEQTWASDDCTYTQGEIGRVAHLAFTSAQKRKKKLTLVDKANVLETSRLWRKVVQGISTEYSDVSVNYMFVDKAAMQVVTDPGQFDVILTDNLFGDVISNEASAITGSPGLLPSASVGNSLALFAPVHGACSEAAGKDIANPLGSILSTAMMLDYFTLFEEAALVKKAVDWTLLHAMVTKDIDPINFYFTSTVGDLICDYIGGRIPGSINKGNVELRKSTII